MRSVGDVFTAAMALMGEDPCCDCGADAVQEYAAMTPAIVDTLVAEYRMMDGSSGVQAQVRCMREGLAGIDDTYALGVMQYGLAAHLLVEENPGAASFYYQRYVELRNIYFSRRGGEDGETWDLYGGIEHGEMGRW